MTWRNVFICSSRVNSSTSGGNNTALRFESAVVTSKFPHIHPLLRRLRESLYKASRRPWRLDAIKTGTLSPQPAFPTLSSLLGIMARSARSSSIISRSPFSTEERAFQWLFKILTYANLIENCYTKPLLKKWSAFCQLVNKGHSVPLSDAPGSRKRILVISVSAYTKPWKALPASQADWKFWTMMGTMAGWNVDVVADSLPIYDPTRQPTRENIRSFAREHLEDNKEGDQFIVVFSGHGDNEGLVLADGSHISTQELRAWFVKPLVSGTRLWTYFDCCESSNLLGLRHKIVSNGSQGTRCQPATGYVGRSDTQGTVISIGSAAGISGDMNLGELHCGPLAWGTYYFFCTTGKEGEPLLAGFFPVMGATLSDRPYQEVQVTTSSTAQEPLLPLLRALPLTATSA